LHAGLALLPPLLQNMYGYSVLQSGILTAPRGVGTLFSMLIAGRLTGKIDARLLVGIGVILMGVSLYLMTGFAIDQPSRPVIISGVVQGLGLGLIVVPLQTLAFETLSTRLRTGGAGRWPGETGRWTRLWSTAYGISLTLADEAGSPLARGSSPRAISRISPASSSASWGSAGTAGS